MSQGRAHGQRLCRVSGLACAHGNPRLLATNAFETREATQAPTGFKIRMPFDNADGFPACDRWGYELICSSVCQGGRVKRRPRPSS